MKAVGILALIAVVCLVDASHLLAGNVADRVVLQIHEKVEYNAIPFIKRVKQKFYTVEPKKIQGIQALDQLQGHASVNVTAGGVGHTFVNLRFKSDRGSGLDYDVGIYVVEDIERLNFEQYTEREDPKMKDWRLPREVEWSDQRMLYTNQKHYLMNLFSVPRLDVPELLTGPDDAYEREKVM